jgi:hypothetical protein
MRDHIVGERKTASFFKGFAWKSLWEGGEVDEDSYNAWVAKYELEFLFQELKEDDEQDEDEESEQSEESRDEEAFSQVTKILSEGFGKSPVDDLISQIKASSLILTNRSLQSMNLHAPHPGSFTCLQPVSSSI